jgi:hypothetical protein
VEWWGSEPQQAVHFIEDMDTVFLFNADPNTAFYFNADPGSN